MDILLAEARLSNSKRYSSFKHNSVARLLNADMSRLVSTAKQQSLGGYTPTIGNPIKSKLYLVSADGLEPSTHALKGHCSAN